jgi:uncharacterized protein YukE
MAYTFAVNTEEIEQLKTTLKNAKDLMNRGIDGIYSEIAAVGNNDSWGGESYSDFQNGAEKYRPALKTLPEVLEAFHTELDRAEKDADPLSASITEAINNMMNS